jgi:hypothetical protein
MNTEAERKREREREREKGKKKREYHTTQTHTQTNKQNAHSTPHTPPFISLSTLIYWFSLHLTHHNRAVRHKCNRCVAPAQVHIPKRESACSLITDSTRTYTHTHMNDTQTYTHVIQNYVFSSHILTTTHLQVCVCIYTQIYERTCIYITYIHNVVHYVQHTLQHIDTLIAHNTKTHLY